MKNTEALSGMFCGLYIFIGIAKSSSLIELGIVVSDIFSGVSLFIICDESVEGEDMSFLGFVITSFSLELLQLRLPIAVQVEAFDRLSLICGT